MDFELTQAQVMFRQAWREVLQRELVPLVEDQIEHYRSIYGNPQLTSVEQVIDDIIGRHRTALAKVKIIHPPTPEITLTYE